MTYFYCKCGEKVLVDDEDLQRISECSWQDTGTALVGRYKGTQMCIANAIMEVFGQKFDHKDTNRHNNQKSNLRPATASQNAANRNPNKLSGGVKGIQLIQRSSLRGTYARYRVIVGKKYIGYFDTLEQAIVAYNTEAIRRWGEFARPIPLPEVQGTDASTALDASPTCEGALTVIAQSQTKNICRQ